MSAKKPSKLCKASYLLLAVIILLLAAAYLFNKSVSSHLRELCRYKCSEVVNRMLTECIKDAVNGEKYYIADISEDGSIRGLSADTSKLNTLQNSVRAALTDRLSADRYEKITITVGDLTDSPFLSGKGSEITVKFQQSGVADTDIKTEFTSAGINQTRVTVSVVASVEFIALLPSGNEKIVVSEELIAADEIIVGKTPAILAENSTRT